MVVRGAETLEEEAKAEASWGEGVKAEASWEEVVKAGASWAEEAKGGGSWAEEVTGVVRMIGDCCRPPPSIPLAPAVHQPTVSNPGEHHTHTRSAGKCCSC